MAYGILIARCSTGWQIVSEVASYGDAEKLALDYIQHADPDQDCAPEWFEIVKCDHRGRYVKYEEVGVQR